MLEQPRPVHPRLRRATATVASAVLAGTLVASAAAALTSTTAASTLTDIAGTIPVPDGTAWLDVDGEEIYAHGGSVIQVSEAEVGLDITGDGTTDQDVWLWYGEDKTNATRPVDGVRGYWSTDLVTWTDMGRVLPSHQFFTLTVEDGQVVVDQGKVEEIKAVAEKAGPDAESTRAELDAAKDFVEPYVESWADEEARVPATYDEEALSHASYRLNGNINIMERPKMLWNATTEKFVIIYHADGPLATSPDLIRWVNEGGDPADHAIGSRYSLAEIGFATSDTPWGPFKLVNTTKMNYVEGVPPATREGDSRDFTVFQDVGSHDVDDVSHDAYAVYSSEMNAWMYISRLNAEYTGPLVEGTDAELGEDFSHRVLPDQHREASAVFRYGDWYYMITSGTDGWASTPVISYRSRSMITDTALVSGTNTHPSTGQWERLDPANPCVGDPDRTGVGTASPAHCFDSQPTFVITLDAENGEYIYMGDRWITEANGSAGSRSRYVWAPIQVNTETGQIAIENVGPWDPTNATLYHRIEPVEPLTFTAHVDDRESFAPTFDVVVNGTRFDGLTADWSSTQLDRAFTGAGTYTVDGHIAEGPLSGRYVSAVLVVDGPVNVCALPGTTISASFHQTQYETLPAGGACDGDPSTSWSTWASSSASPDEVTFTAEFDHAWNLSRLAFINTEGVIESVGVEYRDAGGQWHPTSPATISEVTNDALTSLAFEPVAATGLRLTFATPTYLKINKIAVLGEEIVPDGPVNVCLAYGTTVSASFHQTLYGTFPPSLACDASTSTSWSTWHSTGSRPDNVTFTAEFARAWAIGQVEFTNTEGAIESVGVEYRDAGGQWHATSPATIGEVTNDTPASLEFEPVVASALRLDFQVSGSWVKIPEIEITGWIPEPTEEPSTPEPTSPEPSEEPSTPEPTSPEPSEEPSTPEPTSPEPTEEPSTPEPTQDPGEGTIPAEAPDASELTEETEGGISAPARTRPGATITVSIEGDHAGENVGVWLFSAPAYLGTHVVSAAETIEVELPDVTGGHRLAVYAEDGTLIGWAAIEILSSDGTTGAPSPSTATSPSQDPGDDGLSNTGARAGALLLAALTLTTAGLGLLAWHRRRMTAEG